MKTCTKCNIVKAESNFPRKGNRLESHCKECVRKRKNKWRKANPEKVKAIRRKHYLANPEKDLERKRKWRAEKRGKADSKMVKTIRRIRPLTATMKKPPEIVFPKREMVFTEREKEILARYAYGNTHGETGEELGISPKTVGSFLQRIREKLRAKTRADLITAALKHGLLVAEKPKLKKAKSKR